VDDGIIKLQRCGPRDISAYTHAPSFLAKARSAGGWTLMCCDLGSDLSLRGWPSIFSDDWPRLKTT
jgi:hypothetical protein